MTTAMKWAVIAVLSIAGLGYLTGMAQHDKNTQNNKFNIDCVQAGGKTEYVFGPGVFVCNKN
jgi:hypothetical protein